MPSHASGRRVEVLLLFAWNFCAVGAFFVGRTVRDVLFLVTESPTRLPIMYVASPLVLGLVGTLYVRYAHRVRRERLTQATALISAAALIGARVAIGPRWLTYALYAGVEVMGALAMMQFWGAAGERFTSREAKRIFGRIAAGGTVANIALGLGISVIVARTGAESLLLLCAGFQLAVAALAWVLARHPAPGAHVQGVAPARAAPVRGTPPGTRHLRLVGPMIVCAVVATLLVDFQFKLLATEAWKGDRVAMVRFFGLLSAGTGALALVLQLFVTGRLLGRVGVAGALLVLPLTLGVGALAILVLPSLAAATIGKAADATFRYTVHDAGMQLLYLPVPVRVRGPRKAFLDGVVKPTTEAIAGALLFAYRTSGGARLPIAIAAVGAAAAWAWQAARLRGAYAGALADTLRRRQLGTGARVEQAGAADDGPPMEEPAADDVARACRRALASDDERTVLGALDVARLAPAALAGELRALAADPRAPVRAGALAALAAGGLDLDEGTLSLALADPDDDVRAEAARLAGASAAGAVRAQALLDDPSPAVACAAAEGLVRGGQGAARAAVRARVETLISSPDARARRLGLRVAVILADPSLAPLLAARLEAPREARRAADALAAIGPPALPVLLDALARPGRAAGAARALGAIGGAAALSALAGSLSSADEATRDAAAHALARARRADPFAPVHEATLRRAQADELARAAWAVAAAVGLGRDESELKLDGTRAPVPYQPAGPDGPAALISRTLRERMERARDRALALADALSPGHDLDVITANLRDPEPTRRANAVELLEARVPGDVRAPLVALADETPREAKLGVLGRVTPLPRHARDAWVDLLLDDPSPWLAACAASYAGAHAIFAARPRLEALAASGPAPARDAARRALRRLDHPDEGDPMIGTTERVMFLKGIDLFAAVPGDDLAEIAAITEEVALDEGEVLFREGERGDALYLIVDGGVRIEQGDRLLATLGVREVVGEMALLDPAPRSASAIATAPARLLRLGQDAFAELLAERPEVAAGVLRILTRRLRTASRAE